eukprot:1160545-Pelagomonas_calceolata.AAC.26
MLACEGGAEVDTFGDPTQVPYHYADGPGPINALRDPEGSIQIDEAAFPTSDSHQQRALKTWGHDHDCPDLPGTSGHNYCVPEEGDFCNNCVGGHCRSADRKGADADICRFPERAGGTVPDCKLCSTGCPGIDNSKVWEVPLHVRNETGGEFTVGKLVVWQEPFRELHATVKLDCPWMMWSSLAPNSWWWNRWAEVCKGLERLLKLLPRGCHVSLTYRQQPLKCWIASCLALKAMPTYSHEFGILMSYWLMYKWAS